MSYPVHSRLKKHVGKWLVWYAQPATVEFWEQYWQHTVTTKAFCAALARLETTRTGRALLRHLPRNGVHLEAGCGPGFWVHALRCRGFRVFGVDFSLGPLLTAATTLPGIPLVGGDVLRLPFGDAVFDSYLSFGVVEHREAGPEPFFGEAYRVLKPGGVIVVSVPSFGLIWRLKASFRVYAGVLPSHLVFYQYGFTRRELIWLLTRGGFDPVETFFEGAHRLLQEELPGYTARARRRGGRHLKNLVETILSPFDGHMLVVVGKKPLDSKGSTIRPARGA